MSPNASHPRRPRRRLAPLLAALLVATAGLVASAGPAHAATPPPTPLGAPDPVYRWWSATTTDWRSVPVQGDLEPADADLTAQGYERHESVQYYVSMVGGSDPDLVPVYQ